jgi:hypothetical protein
MSNKEGTFSKERGHDSREKNYVNFWSKYFSAMGDRTIRIHTVHTVYTILYSLYSCTDLGTKIEAFRARFLSRFLDFWWLFLGCME